MTVRKVKKQTSQILQRIFGYPSINGKLANDAEKQTLALALNKIGKSKKKNQNKND